MVNRMRRRLIRRTLIWHAVGLALLSASAVHAQLPTGAVVANGTAPISSDGTTMTITNTDGAIIDWQSFSIGAANTVQFVQGASSRVLNRVGGTAPSSILGQLNSSGAVYLLNPNGIVFGANATVNVGGLIASTLAMSNSDFINDKRLLSNNASAASVINNGTITSSGDVVLVANTVTNNGTISAPGKTVNLAAGRAIQEVDSANLTQDHIVLADSATPNVFVVLDTAADHTATNLGNIVANDGSVNIYGALVSNSGTMDASSHSGAGGYVEMIATQHINLSDTSALTVDAKTDGGDIYLTTNNVRSYTSLPTDPSGIIDLGGTISAQTVTTAPAPVYGRVSVDALAVDLGNVQVSTGQGELVITQPGILVDATASGITGAKLATQLDTTHVVLFASSATSTTASLSIHDDVSWANHTLTLFADGEIVIFNPMNGTGTASLALAYGQGGSANEWLGSLSIHAPIGLNEGGGFSTKQGYDGSTKAYDVITTLTKLQNVQASASNQFVLGANIDATNSTFTPIGNLTSPFNKELWGLGHIISNLTINQSTDFVGLFGHTADQAVIHDLGLVNATITGSSKVGALVGQADSSWIYNVFADADVSGGADTGGLVGLLNGGTVQYAYASGSVFGADNTVGGLVGNNNGWIENSYANAAVSISATAFAPGGLVGVQGTSGSTLKSFWDTDASGQNRSDGGAPLSSAQIKQKASYANWYDISSTGESPTRWRIYEDSTAPLLNVFLTPLTITAVSETKTYDGGAYVPSSGVTLSRQVQAALLGPLTYSGDAIGATDAGSYLITPGGYYSSAAGYDIHFVDGLLVIDPKLLTLSLADKTYDASTAVLSGQAQLAGVLSGDTVSIQSITGDYADKHVGNAKTVSLSDVLLTGADAANYMVDMTPAFSAGITPLALSLSLADKTYDASTAVLSSQAQLAGVLSGDAVSIQSVTGDYADKHVGTTKTVNLSGVVLTGADAANYTVDVTPAFSAGITPLALSVSLADKTYDASTTVFTGQAQLAGVLSGDAVSIQSVTGGYADKHVGTAKTVNLSGVVLTGADAANYTLDVTPAFSAGITPLALSLSLADKTYDGSAAVLSGQVQVSGVLSGDAVTVQSVTGAYADKNVASDKRVTLSRVVLGGADGQNYTPVLASAYSTDILQLASVAWVGTSGNWSDAANWAGGALPEGNNVANVVIPSLAVVTLDANVADITLSSLSSEGRLIIDGGHLIINTSLSSATLNLLSGWILGAGSVSVSNGLTMDTGVLNVSGNIAITSVGDLNLSGMSAGGSLNIAAGGRLSSSDTLTANTITIAANSIGAIGAPVLTTTTSLDLSASGGDIWLSNTGAVILTRAIAQGAVVIDAYGGLSTGADQIRANSGSVTLRAHSPLRVGSGGLYGSMGVDLQALSTRGDSTITIDGSLMAESSATISLASYGSVSLNSDISGGSVIVSSTSGDVKLNGGMITATTGDITLSATQGTVLNTGAQYSSPPNISDTVSAAAAFEAASNTSVDALTSTSLTSTSTTLDVSVQETNVDASAMSPSSSTETADTTSSSSGSPAQASAEGADSDASADTSSETSAQAPAETPSKTSSDSVDQASESTTPTAATENTDDAANGSDSHASASGEAAPSGAFQQANALIEQRHEIKTEALAQALDALEKDPNAADLKDCTGADDGSLCIATAQAHGDMPVRITPGARLPQIQRKIALLFGVNAYQDPIPSLKTPTNDVASVANILRQQQGYDVRVFENPTKRDIVQAVNRVIHESTVNDSVLLYYAGHGYVLPKTKTGYWIPTDGDARNPANWISNNDVARMLHNLPARQVLLISDSCYSGKLAEGDVNDLAVGQVTPREVLKKRSVVVFSSGGDEPVSDAGVGENSIFAHALVGAMTQGDGVTPGQALASRVHKQVTQSFPQQPRYTPLASAGHQSGGDYLFERRSRAAN